MIKMFVYLILIIGFISFARGHDYCNAGLSAEEKPNCPSGTECRAVYHYIGPPFSEEEPPVPGTYTEYYGGHCETMEFCKINWDIFGQGPFLSPITGFQTNEPTLPFNNYKEATEYCKKCDSFTGRKIPDIEKDGKDCNYMALFGVKKAVCIYGECKKNACYDRAEKKVNEKKDIDSSELFIQFKNFINFIKAKLERTGWSEPYRCRKLDLCDSEEIPSISSGGYRPKLPADASSNVNCQENKQSGEMDIQEYGVGQADDPAVLTDSTSQRVLTRLLKDVMNKLEDIKKEYKKGKCSNPQCDVDIEITIDPESVKFNPIDPSTAKAYYKLRCVGKSETYEMFGYAEKYKYCQNTI